MKTHGLGLLCLLLTVSTDVAHAQTAWLLVRRPAQFAVVRAQGETVRDVVAFRDSAPIYGESRTVVAVVSGGGWAHVVNKESATVASFQLASWPQFIGAPTADLSGPLRNVLVTDQHMFFPTGRHFEQVPLNQLGGGYDIVEMSLVDGSLRSIPLPANLLAPRLAEIGGVPVVYAHASDKVWKLDAENVRVVRILWDDDVADLRTKEVAGLRRAPETPRAFIRHAIVPSAGVFRLSRLGELDKILDANLATISARPGSVGLGPAHDVLSVLSGTTNDSPAVGVVRRQERRVTFSYLEASSLDVAWVSDVTQGAIPASFYPADDGSVFYIDAVTGVVNRLSQKDGSSTSWRLQPGQSRSSRILSIDLGG